MSETIKMAVWPTDFIAVSKADRDHHPCYTLEALLVALQAAKLAIEAAEEVPRKVSFDQPTVIQIFESWAATNLLVHTVFDQLYAQAQQTLSILKP